MNNELYKKSEERISKNIAFLNEEARKLHKSNSFKENPEQYKEKMDKYKKEVLFYLKMKHELISKYRAQHISKE